VGTAFGLLAGTAWSHAKDACGGNPAACVASGVPSATSDRHTAMTDATISTAGFVAGGVLAATGIVFILTGSNRGPSSASALLLSPTDGAGRPGLSLTAAF
jgi:hypothetical protein